MKARAVVTQPLVFLGFRSKSKKYQEVEYYIEETGEHIATVYKRQSRKSPVNGEFHWLCRRCGGSGTRDDDAYLMPNGIPWCRSCRGKGAHLLKTDLLQALKHELARQQRGKEATR